MLLRSLLLSLTAGLAAVSFSSAASAQKALTVAAGAKARIVESGFNPNTCISHGEAKVTVFEKPINGQIRVEQEQITITDDPSGRTRCGGQKAAGAVVFYTPNKGFKGSDKFAYRVVIGNGAPRVQSYAVTVR